MLDRRNFIKINGITAAGLSTGLKPAWFTNNFESHRPKPADRKFTGKAVEAFIKSVKA